MSKSSNVSPTRSVGNSSSVRPESAGDEDRSFAEIRRLLHDVLRILSLHPWAFFVPFCIATSVAFVISLSSPRTYSAYTTFERQLDPVGLDLTMSTGAAAFNHYRNTMVQDIKSVEVVGEALEAIGRTDDFERADDGALTPAAIAQRDSIARGLSYALSVNTKAAGKLMETVRITYTGSDPRIGKPLVDAVKEAYIRRTQAWIRSFLIDQRDYYAAQLVRAEEELLEARRDATQFRLEHPFVDPTDPGAINRQIAQLQTRQRDLELQRQSLRTDVAAQEELLAAFSSTPHLQQQGAASSAQQGVPISVEALKLHKEIADATEEVESLRLTRGMTIHHPRIVELMATRKRAEAMLERQNELDHRAAAKRASAMVANGGVVVPAAPQQPWNADRARAETRLASLQIKVREVSTDLRENAALTERLRQAKKDIFGKQEEFAVVEDRVAKARQKHRRLEGMLASINPAIEATNNGRLVHFNRGAEARGSRLPIAPKARNVMFVSLLIGLGAGAIILILAEVLDHVYRSSTQIARSLGLPILEAIDEIITIGDRRKILVRRLVVVPLVLGLGLGATGLTGAMAYLSLTRPTTYHKLRRIPEAAIEFFAGQDAVRPPRRSTPKVS